MCIRPAPKSQRCKLLHRPEFFISQDGKQRGGGRAGGEEEEKERNLP